MLNNPLYFYIRMFGKWFWLGMFFLLVTNVLDGLYPLVIKQALDAVQSGQEWTEALKWAALFFGMMSMLAVTRFAWRMFFGTYHTNAAEHIRRELYRHLIHLGPRYFSKNQIGELMSTLVNDVQSFRQAIGSSILILVDGTIIVLVVLPVMASLNFSWTWKTLILLPTIPFVIRYLTRLIFDRYTIEQENLAKLSGHTQESISGIRVIKSFVVENIRLKSYQTLNRKYELSANRVALADSFFSPVMEFGVAVGSVILIFVARDELLTGVATIGTFVAFQRYINKMMWPMTAFGFGFSQYQKGMASFQRIRHILEQKPEVVDRGTQRLEKFESLELRNFSFSFEEKKLFTNLNLKIRAGERVGFVGPIGSGKSTLALALCRVYESRDDQYLVNGQPAAFWTLKSLREKILLIPQEPWLFSVSILENMRLGNPRASETEILEWLDRVQIKNEILALPSGLDTQLGERGVNLSGGQKQRLALARGFLTQPEVLVLDDVMSAVDHETEEKLVQAIQTWKKTLILVTHRLHPLRHFDRIVVFNENRIEAQGTWEEVLAESKTFQDIVQLQGLDPK